jgi:hypothetical protein
MPALLERTKIRSDWGSSSTNENLVARDLNQLAIMPGDPFSVDVYAYGLLPGSTKVTVLPYLPQPSDKAKEYLKKIYRFGRLPENWDNDGAFPPEEKIILSASQFVLQMDELDLPVYFVAPGPNGEIFIEYRKQKKTAEIFFNDDGTEEMILYKRNEQVYSGEINTDLFINHLR